MKGWSFKKIIETGKNPDDLIRFYKNITGNIVEYQWIETKTYSKNWYTVFCSILEDDYFENRTFYDNLFYNPLVLFLDKEEDDR